MGAKKTFFQRSKVVKMGQIWPAEVRHHHFVSGRGGGKGLWGGTPPHYIHPCAAPCHTHTATAIATAAQPPIHTNTHTHTHTHTHIYMQLNTHTYPTPTPCVCAPVSRSLDPLWPNMVEQQRQPQSLLSRVVPAMAKSVTIDTGPATAYRRTYVISCVWRCGLTSFGHRFVP